MKHSPRHKTRGYKYHVCLLMYGHPRTSIDECKCMPGNYVVNSTDGASTCKACPAGVECLGAFSEDPRPVARPLYYLHTSTSDQLIVMRCKVDRGEVCQGSSKCTIIIRSAASAIRENTYFISRRRYVIGFTSCPPLVNSIQRWSALDWQHHGEVRRRGWDALPLAV